jgi:asparagine N-glycosylation enzyme membrane subunit Stt3
MWAILFAVFGALIAYFATDGNYAVIAIAAAIAAVLGYVIGKSMEKDASHKG